jgi:hypothetical protein
MFSFLVFHLLAGWHCIRLILIRGSPQSIGSEKDFELADLIFFSIWRHGSANRLVRATQTGALDIVKPVSID